MNFKLADEALRQNRERLHRAVTRLPTDCEPYGERERREGATAPPRRCRKGSPLLGGTRGELPACNVLVLAEWDEDAAPGKEEEVG